MRGDLRFVARADALRFCLRNNVRPTRHIARAAALLAVVALVAVLPAAGLLAGFVLVALGRPLDVGADAISGALLVVVIGRAVACAVRGASAGSRTRVFAAPDIAVLRHFEISLAAVLAVRVAAPAVLGQVAGALLAGGALVGIGRGYGAPVDPAWLWSVAAVALAGSVSAAAAAARPPVERPSRGRAVAALGLLLAAAAGWLIGRIGVAAAELLAATGTPAVIAQAAGVGSSVAAAVGRPLAVAVPLGVALVAAATLVPGGGARWRAVLRPRSGPAGIGRRCRPVDLVPSAVRRSEQGSAALARRAARTFTLLGAALVGCGFAAPGRFDLAGSGLDGVAGGGVLLAVGLVLGGLVRSLTGPAGWARQLRWTVERGVPRRTLVVGYIAGSLRPLLPVVAVCTGLALLTGDAAVVLFGVCVVLVATASGVLGDLWDGGTQDGADGSTESTAAGAAVGILAVAAGVAPWAVLPEPASWVAGPVLAVLLLGGAAVLLDRKVLG